MNKQTYKRLTTPTFRMRLSSLKMTFKARLLPHYVTLLNILVKVKIIKKHELCKSYISKQISPKALPCYVTCRGTYDLSYFAEEIRTDNELWWETKSGKRINVIADSHTARTNVMFKVIPESFNVLLPDHRVIKADRPHNGECLKVMLKKPIVPMCNVGVDTLLLEPETITLDFAKAVFKFSRKYTEPLDEIPFNVKLENSQRELHQLLMSEKFEKEVNNILLRNV